MTPVGNVIIRVKYGISQDYLLLFLPTMWDLPSTWQYGNKSTFPSKEKKHYPRNEIKGQLLTLAVFSSVFVKPWACGSLEIHPGVHTKTGPLALCREAVLVIHPFGKLLVLFQGCALLTGDNAHEFAPRHVFEAGQVIPLKRKIQT